MLSSLQVGNFSSQSPLWQVSPQISQHCQSHERERDIPLCSEHPPGDHWSWEAGECPWMDTAGDKTSWGISRMQRMDNQ